jgi:hypothetical protein
MRRLSETLALLVAVVAALAGAAWNGNARAEAPELFEREVLPTTPALPTCACGVQMRDGTQLVVGLADGEIVSFHETAGSVIPRIVKLPGSGPVDDVVSCCVGRIAGNTNEFALLVVRGRELLSIGYGDLAVAAHVTLPPPQGRYRFAKSWRDPHSSGSYAKPDSDYPVLYDDDSAMSVSVETRTLRPRIETVLDGVARLSVTELSDRVTVSSGVRVLDFPANGGPVVDIDEWRKTGTRIMIGAWEVGGRTLEIRVTDPDSTRITRTVTAHTLVRHRMGGAGWPQRPDRGRQRPRLARVRHHSRWQLHCRPGRRPEPVDVRLGSDAAVGPRLAGRRCDARGRRLRR